MLALCLMLSVTYYAQNHAGIIGLGLAKAMPINDNDSSCHITAVELV